MMKDGAWIQRYQWREERLRYEFLSRVYQESGAATDRVLPVCDFAEQLGIWPQELFRAVEFLERRAYLVYHGVGPRVSITVKGIDYIARYARRRRSLREE